MRKLLAVLAIFVTVLMPVASCDGGSPKAVVRKVVESSKDDDQLVLDTYVDFSSLTDFEIGAVGQLKHATEILNAKTVEDRATVDVNVLEPGLTAPILLQLGLTKSDKYWRITEVANMSEYYKATQEARDSALARANAEIIGRITEIAPVGEMHRTIDTVRVGGLFPYLRYDATVRFPVENKSDRPVRLQVSVDFPGGYNLRIVNAEPISPGQTGHLEASTSYKESLWHDNEALLEGLLHGTPTITPTSLVFVDGAKQDTLRPYESWYEYLAHLSR